MPRAHKLPAIQQEMDFSTGTHLRLAARACNVIQVISFVLVSEPRTVRSVYQVTQSLKEVIISCYVYIKQLVIESEQSKYCTVQV